ncbi:S-adenosyl-L-methionine-dependent methyltransferase [Colletotrichum navitas]|uniref:S-adenosyl-L-methionine-dependent methyltransferase n=1 Tax=Colletotrichum navitas TaxID=681940 RepID=A0AAD8PYM8_9PEZI|nr:S-adenosyl-L-methionine-dependent methyltransferase [Colletotrichum navitas]KAK1590435.1 S-adenosyl-L-methionine-dependent methyltransferase [Colletotrichum navitas]
MSDLIRPLGPDPDEFCRKHPNAPGRHIPQDLPPVLVQVQNIDPKIEPMAYDFHTEQPIKGARAYYMHSVLHDWTDKTTALDIMMMTLFSAKERTEEQWRNLLEPAGLKIVKIWTKGEGVESLIECELA